MPMPRLEYSERFADDLATIRADKLESRIFGILDSLEFFGTFGSSQVPQSDTERFGHANRKDHSFRQLCICGAHESTTPGSLAFTNPQSLATSFAAHRREICCATESRDLSIGS